MPFRLPIAAARGLLWALLGPLALAAAAQTTPPPATGSALAPGAAGGALTLDQALQRARANSPDFQAALVAQGLAHEDTAQARAALLPGVNYDSSYLYTQGGRFIANNGVHEYVSQGNVHEDLSVASAATLRRDRASEALARAQAEVALRGLAATVTGDYYNVIAAAHKLATAQQALAEAQRYLGISQDLEQGGEAAHTDVIKAQLEQQQKQRQVTEAALAETRARLDLSVLLFKDFNQTYTLDDDLDRLPAVPGLEPLQALAGANNPALSAAQAGVAQAGADAAVARAALLPTVALDYWYGIDAPQYATHGPQGTPYLGSAAQASLNLPLWNWGANRSKLRQAALRQQQAALELGAAQRQLQANLIEAHAEAQAAHDEMTTLASSRDLAAESLRLTGLRYQAGEATILELVDAQNTAADARDAYDDGEVRYHVALAQLAALAGRLQP